MLSGTNSKEKNNSNSLCIKRHEEKIGEFLIKFCDFGKKGQFSGQKSQRFHINRGVFKAKNSWKGVISQNGEH